LKWYLVRHGEIEANRKKIYAGRSNEPLTVKGRGQALEVAEKLATQGIKAIYCSPVWRAVETATIIGDLLGQTPILADDFRELGLGIWEGKTESEIARDFPEQWAIWSNRPAELVLAGRETLESLLQRVLQGLQRIKSQNKSDSILIVTHVAIIRVLLLHFHHLDLNRYRTIPIPNGKIFLLESHPDS